MHGIGYWQVEGRVGLLLHDVVVMNVVYSEWAPKPQR